MKQKLLFIFALLCMVTQGAWAQSSTNNSEVTTVADKGESGIFYATFCPQKDVAIGKDDAEVFSIYTDLGCPYFSKLRVRSGKYVIKAGDPVIVKTTEAKTILLTTSEDVSSIYYSDIVCPNADKSVSDFRKEMSLEDEDAIFLLTNMAKNGGFGFTKFTGDKMKRGNFYIVVMKNKTRAAKDIEDGDPVPFLEGEAGNDDGFTAQGQSIDAKVKLSKTKATIEKGKTLTLKATITPSDLADKSVTWKSSNTKIATVTSAGKVKGVKAGTATITCTSKATGAKATCKVTVGYVKLDKTEAIINKGKTMTLKATVYPSTLTDRSVTWKSSNTKVATVTSKGKVKGVKAGTATITCTSKATGLKTTCEVTVGYVKLDQTEVTVNKGKTVTLKATVYPSSLEDRSVTWESSNTKVATVTSKGKVKGVKAGTATITCTSNATGLSTTCVVTVTTTASILSLEGGDKDEVTEINEVEASAAIKPFDVFDLTGRKVLQQVTSLDGLPDGIYIVNGKKILKKD